MKEFIAALIIAVVLIGGAVLLVNSGNFSNSEAVPANNVTIVDGKQVVDLQARGGYTPQKSTAKAGMPTTLKITTKGTFDCSSSIRIASLNVSKALPPSGVTEIDLGTPQAGILRGSCGMGMYPFDIDFQG